MNSDRSSRMVRWLVLCSIIVVFTVLSVRSCYRRSAEEYRRFTSPDGRFEVVVYRLPMLVSMPGQSGDASGYVQLRDSGGKVLHEKSVNMIQEVEEPRWTSSNVTIKLLVQWDLPSVPAGRVRSTEPTPQRVE